MDVIGELKNVFQTSAEIGDQFDKFNVRSIARGAHEQSFQFPCMIDDTVDAVHAATMAKSLDRVYASWTQIYLSSVGVIDLNYIKNPRQFIAKYQPKMNLESFDEEVEADEDLVYGMWGEETQLWTGSTRTGHPVLFVINQGKPTVGARNAMREGCKLYLEGYNIDGLHKRTFMEATPDVLDSIMNQNEREAARKDLEASKEARGPQMSKNDVKRINDMEPYVIELRLLAAKGDSSFAQWVNYNIGVKTILHLGSKQQIQNAIVDVLRNRNPIFNFVRWTTGEISLMKDIILHIDDINFDVASKSDKTGKFISSLKKMRKKYLKVGTFGVNRIAPFATIVISTQTYLDIKDRYGYDLKNMAFASKLMDQLFLMCFVILDATTETMDILIDGQSDYQSYALDTLEREARMNSDKFGAEISRMLTKG